MVLTDKRLLATNSLRQNGEELRSSENRELQAVPLSEGAELKLREVGGAGKLELIGPEGRLGHWRYTAGRGAAAREMVRKLVSLRSERAANRFRKLPSVPVAEPPSRLGRRDVLPARRRSRSLRSPRWSG